MGRRIDLTGPPRLQPSDIRRIARDIGPSCTEIDLGYGQHDVHNDDDEYGNDDDELLFSPFQVLSFLVQEPATGAVTNTNNKDDDASSSMEQSIARINIYYQTGTVAICRALHGQVRQVFRRRCTLSALEKILRDPPQLTLDGLSASLVDEAAYELGDDETVNGDNGDAANKKELRRERQLHRDIDLCDSGMAILRGELTWIEGQSAALAEAQLALADEAAERATRKKKQKGAGDGGSEEDGDSEEDDESDDESDDDEEDYGDSSDNDHDHDSLSSRREFEFNLPQDTVADVETFLADSTHDPVRCVAINGIGAVLLYRRGSGPTPPMGCPRSSRGRSTSMVTRKILVVLMVTGDNTRHLATWPWEPRDGIFYRLDPVDTAEYGTARRVSTRFSQAA